MSCSEPNEAGCGCESAVFDGASPAYRRVLLAVIAINALGFAVVTAGAAMQGSSALAANGLDFLGDAATYSLSLWAIGKSVRVRSGAALIKGGSLAGLAVVVVGFSAWRLISAAPLNGLSISALGVFGILANLAAAGLLLRWRDGDANVRSVWLCTRNDLIHCAAVAVAGGLVAWSGSRWPDLLVGVVLAAVFLRSALQIVGQARAEMRPAATSAPAFQIAVRTQARAR